MLSFIEELAHYSRQPSKHTHPWYDFLNILFFITLATTLQLTSNFINLSCCGYSKSKMGRSKIQMQKYDKFQIGFWISRQTAPMFEMSHLHLCIMATLQRRVMSKPLLQPNMETHLKRLISSSSHLNFLEGGSRVIAHKNREPEEADDTLCGLSPGYHLVRFSQLTRLWMSASRQ